MQRAAEDTLNASFNQWLTIISVDDLIEILDQAIERLEERREQPIRVKEKGAA